MPPKKRSAQSQKGRTPKRVKDEEKEKDQSIARPSQTTLTATAPNTNANAGAVPANEDRSNTIDESPTPLPNPDGKVDFGPFVTPPPRSPRPADEARIPSPPPALHLAAPREGATGFLDLPSELRLRILYHLIPRGYVIRYDDFTGKAKAHGQDGEPHLRRITNPEHVRFVHKGRNRILRFWQFPQTETNIFLVNKFICNEARAILYGENRYVFTIDSAQHQPISLSSPAIFGLFQEPYRLPLLRELRSISLDILVNDFSHWAVKRHRHRLAYFVQILKQHSDDVNQRSLLQNLNINFSAQPPVIHFARNPVGGYQPPTPPPFTPNSPYVSGLESLAQLRGIEEVRVGRGSMPPAFAKCLELCISGKGGDVLPLEYPELEVRRKVKVGKGKFSSRKKYEMIKVTTKKWGDPLLNWREFAVRNKIKLPVEDVEESAGSVFGGVGS